jgi:hypothetical protein
MRVSSVPSNPSLTFLGLVIFIRLYFVFNSNTITCVQLLVQREFRTYSYSENFFM